MWGSCRSLRRMMEFSGAVLPAPSSTTLPSTAVKSVNFHGISEPHTHNTCNIHKRVDSHRLPPPGNHGLICWRFSIKLPLSPTVSLCVCLSCDVHWRLDDVYSSFVSAQNVCFCVEREFCVSRGRSREVSPAWSMKRLSAASDINTFITSTRFTCVATDASVPFFMGTVPDCSMNAVPKGSWVESAKLSILLFGKWKMKNKKKKTCML